MTINKRNAKIINSREIYLHDDILLKLFFDRVNKNMVLEFKKYSHFNQIYKIEFINVIGFEMSACDFWGMSECVLDFEFIEDLNERIIVPKLMEKWQKTSNLTNTDLYDSYIEVLFTFGSGDCLRIACEKISFDKEQTGEEQTGDGGVSPK